MTNFEETGFDTRSLAPPPDGTHTVKLSLSTALTETGVAVGHNEARQVLYQRLSDARGPGRRGPQEDV